MMATSILRMNGPDAKGLVFKVSETLFKNDCNILKQDEFVSPDAQFYMRTVFTHKEDLDKILLIKRLNEHISNADIKFELKQERVKNVILFCTKEHHCISEIINRQYFNELNINIVAVISNHNFLREYVEKFNIPFHYVTHENLSRELHEEEIFKITENYSFEHVVLAKYMRILTPSFVKKFEGKIINIHHSFLPAFIGANPYKQAFERGVKIIGATAHFVNDMLDEGPIITQGTKDIDHSLTAKEMAKEGRDVEKKVLISALNLVLADRVFINGNRTIIL
jgi:formyltetrahydrofolate deformylase